MVVSANYPGHLTFVQYKISHKGGRKEDKGLTLMSSISQIFFTSSMEV